jgi:hypothetical protein
VRDGDADLTSSAGMCRVCDGNGGCRVK